MRDDRGWRSILGGLLYWALIGLLCLLLAGSVVQVDEAAAQNPEPLTRMVYIPYYVSQPRAKLGLSGGTTAQTAVLGGSWYYAWGPNGRSTDGVEFVPMIWGEATMTATVQTDAVWLLGFNEPDGQSLVPPERAAELWRQLEAMHPERKLASPGPSHLDPGWLKRMRTAYITEYGEPPRFDALCAHSYRATANEVIADLRIYLDWAEAWGVPEVWLTEFAVLPGWSGPGWEYELRTLLAWLEAEPRITRYSPFVGHLDVPHWTWPTSDPLLNPSLFTEAGGLVLTDVGRAYAGR